MLLKFKKGKMKKLFNIFITIAFIFLSIGFISTHGEETFAQAEELIKQKISCENLTQEQLEILGDYYMEQMHPGELHEIMDERMGGEGSESLKQVHINMGLTFYCGEVGGMSSGMMNTMMGRGMMGNWGYSGINFWIFNILFIIVIVLLIILLIKSFKKRRLKNK